MTKYANIYQRFLNLANALDQLTEFPQLSPDEKFLMLQLNNYWIKNQEVKVVEVIKSIKESSPATVFRNLKKLRLKGYVELRVDEEDNRVEYIKPTNLTISYFDAHGKIILKTAKLGA
jgi:DNA-binding MarR family transcriptional regulator